MGFKLTDRIGFSPPLQLTVVHEEGFYEKHIDFEKLKVALKEANPNPYEIFDYHDFVSHKMVSLKLKDRESGEVHTAEYLTTVPFSVTRDDGEVEELILYGRLNKKIGDVRTDITISRLRIDGKKRLTHYSFLFVYKNFDARVNTSDRDDIHRVAIEVKAIFYEHYLAANNYLGYNNKQLDEEVFEKFTEAFAVSQANSFDLAYLINKAPNFVLQRRALDLLWIDLYALLEDFVLNSKEKAILRILGALAVGESNINSEDKEEKAKFKYRANNFFKDLSLHNKGVSVFKLLYAKMNDYGFGGKHFSILIKTLYKFWLFSDYSKPDDKRNEKDYKGGPEVLVYDTKKMLGFYSSPFEFNFVQRESRIKIEVIKTEYVEYSVTYARRPRLRELKIPIGEYELFHPIVLADAPKGGELSAPPTNVLPAFYLKAFNDKLKWANIDTGVWLAVDGATTLTGVGNLLKLRHLRHLSKLKKLSTLFKVKTAVSIVEITTGTLNVLLTLADSDSEFSQKLRQHLFWLEMASLGVDVVVEKLLRKSAREALEHADDITDAVVKLHLEEVADAVFIRRGRYLGQALDDIHFEKIRVFLKKFKVDLQIGPSKGSFKVEDYFYSSGKVFEMRPQNAALFITNGKTMRLVLRKNSTTYELLHELMHLRHSQKLGLSNYYSLGKQGLNGTIIRERYVFDKLMEHSKYLNKSEVNHAIYYLNRYYDDFGITDNLGNPLKAEIPFNIDDIPKKRQGINIDKLLELK